MKIKNFMLEKLSPQREDSLLSLHTGAFFLKQLTFNEEENNILKVVFIFFNTVTVLVLEDNVFMFGLKCLISS